MTAAERPATGATDADIEAAAERDWTSHQAQPWDATDSYCQRYLMFAREYSQHLVPPGTVIALAEHVAAAADRAAIGRAAQQMNERRDDHCRDYARDMVNRRNGDCTYEEIEAWEAEALEAWGKRFPHLDADLARMGRLSGEGERE